MDILGQSFQLRNTFILAIVSDIIVKCLRCSGISNVEISSSAIMGCLPCVVKTVQKRPFGIGLT